MQRIQYPFNIFFNNKTQKRIFSPNKFLGERIFIGLCLSCNLKWVFRIDTLLKTDFGSTAIYFAFRCLYELLFSCNFFYKMGIIAFSFVFKK
jgi:hypothetical protein